MNISRWNKETRQAYVGTLLYSLFGILASLIAPAVATRKVAGAFSSLTGAGKAGAGFLGVLLIIVEICVICGYIIFFLAAKDLKEITEGEDQKAFKKIYLSVIFNIVGSIFMMIPGLHWLGGIFNFASCILLILAFNALKTSQTLSAVSPAAVAGFGNLFIAELLVIIGICICWIPILGIVGGILEAVAWVLVILGWKKVATPVAEPGEAPVAEKPLFESIKEVVSESFVEAKDVVKEAAGDIKEKFDNSEKKAEETVEETVDAVEETVEETVSEAVEAGSNAVEETVDAATEVVEETVSEAVEAGSNAVEETVEETVEAATEVVEETVDAVEEVVKPEEPKE